MASIELNCGRFVVFTEKCGTSSRWMAILIFCQTRNYSVIGYSSRTFLSSSVQCTSPFATVYVHLLPVAVHVCENDFRCVGRTATGNGTRDWVYTRSAIEAGRVRGLCRSSFVAASVARTDATIDCRVDVMKVGGLEKDDVGRGRCRYRRLGRREPSTVASGLVD